MKKLKKKPIQALDEFLPSGSTVRSELKGVGTAVLTVLVTEIVERTVERVFQKLTESDRADRAKTDIEMDADVDASTAPEVDAASNPIAKLRGQLEQANPRVKETLGQVQAAVSQFSPTVAEVVDVIKQAGNPMDRLKQTGHAVDGPDHLDRERMTAPLFQTVAPKAAGKKAKKKGKKKRKKD